MKTFIASAVLAAALATPALAAGGGDMAELKCSELLSGSAEDIGVILFWLDGYVSHKTGVTTVDFDQVKANGQKIGEYCGANPDAKVLDYVESNTGG